MRASSLRRTGPTLALAVAGVLGAVGVAHAQSTGGTAGSAQHAAPAAPAATGMPSPAAVPPTSTGMPAPATAGHAAAAQAGHASARAEQQITRLRRALHITTAQTQQWDAFAQVMRANAEHMDSLYEQQAQNAQSLNAVDGLKSYEQIAQAHLEDLQKLEPAFETLYSSLSDSQKRAADELFRNRAARRAGASASRTE